MQNKPNHPRPPFRPNNRPTGPLPQPGTRPDTRSQGRPASNDNRPHNDRDRRPYQGQGQRGPAGHSDQRDNRDSRPPAENIWQRKDRRDARPSSGGTWRRDDRRPNPPRQTTDQSSAPRRDFQPPAGVEWRSDDQPTQAPRPAPPLHNTPAAPPEISHRKSPEGKVTWKPGNMLYPAPVVLVCSGSRPEEYNVMTVAWAGNICTDPPLCAISLKPTRHSFELIQKNREFTINLTTRDMVRVVDWCGVKSGSEVNKFKETGLPWLKAQVVRAPLIAASPVNIECKVKDIQALGSHHLIIGEVVALHASPKYLDERTKYFNLAQAGLLCYAHGKYYIMGQEIGKFGFSVQKRRH
jgi:flavin reductase (DIM6/NTAB) family NADH-FMN oxidoreductase RutF